MSDEVSCQVLDVFFQRLRKEKRPAELLLQGVPYPLAHLQKRHARMGWEAFATFMANAGAVWSPKELEEIGTLLFKAPAMRAMSLVARFLFTAEGFYRWVFEKQTGAGDQSFTTFQHHLKVVGPNLLELELVLAEGYRDVPEFYRVALGNFTGMPSAVGLPHAEVTMTRLPRGARYRVKVPEGGGLLPRLKRALLLPLTAPAVASELKASLTELQGRFEDLSTARATLAAQTERLQIVDRLGRDLARQTDLEGLAAALARVFSEALPSVGLRVQVAGEGTDALEPLCSSGDTEGAPLRQYPLSSGGEVVGRLEVFGHSDAPLLPLVEDLVPWVSIALGNARAFTLLRGYRDSLSQKVEERTAALNQAMARAEDSLRREREAIRRKTEFFHNVSHELRTPLTLILLTLDSLQTNEPGLSASARAHLERVDRSASRLLKLINDLLDLARLESGHLRLHHQAVDIRRLLEGVMIPFKVLAERKGLAFRLECGEVQPLFADPERLDLIFQNLISNALKFTDKGEVLLRVTQDGMYLHVEVKDSGVGISAKDQEVIFERFAQADEAGNRRFGGTGIGLALVKETVELHGGNIQVRSEPGRGATFRVSLPRGEAHLDQAPAPPREAQRPLWDLRLRAAGSEPEEAPPPTAAPAGEAAGGEKRRRILVVEDDPEVRASLRAILSAHFEVAVAKDGREGLALAAQVRPELVLSDVMMPVMSGLQLLEGLRTDPRTADLPVILLTARHELDARVEGLGQGANDYLSKPFSPRELVARIATQLRLRDAAARAAQSERLAATSLLTAGFAHEVRNPLNGLVNALSPLRAALAEGGDRALGAEMLDIVEECARRVRHLSDSLLDLVRGGGEAEVEVGATLDAAFRALEWKWPADVRWERDCPDDLPPVKADPAALTQVWINLVDNALRAVKPQGQVRVRAWHDGGQVAVEVTDDGEGISRQNLQRLFDPFFSTRPAGEGTGLGLSLCRRIVTRHGGDIDVESSPGEGTTVTVRLPAMEAPALSRSG